MGRTDAPVFAGDPQAAPRLEESLGAAMAATEGYGSWPSGRWELRLHMDASSFERATGAPPGRGAQWIGDVLHLRPWEQLKRRDLGALLRHELVHRRLLPLSLRPWEEEARCLHAETHVRPPSRWPAPPDAPVQARLDRALRGGSTREQAWAYGAIRAWFAGRPLPQPPLKPIPHPETWRKEALNLGGRVVVVWPPERLPRDLELNGQPVSRLRGNEVSFQGEVRFKGGGSLGKLRGAVTLRRRGRGWSLCWATTPEAWVAAATDGELGREAPFEARRALASVLKRWIQGHPWGNHGDGSLCPLTHCAVIRGEGSEETKRAVLSAPGLETQGAFFCGSKGGVSLSPRQVWGEGSDAPGGAEPIPGDRWLTWTRTLTAAQVRLIKGSVRPGLRPGQKGLMLGASGPYVVEELRLAAGRAFGWTAWPSNACEGELDAQGRLHLRGHGWGHNVGLCLATASFQARRGLKAEAILADAFGIDSILLK